MPIYQHGLIHASLFFIFRVFSPKKFPVTQLHSGCAEHFKWFCENGEDGGVGEDGGAVFLAVPEDRPDFGEAEEAGDGQIRKKFAEGVEVNVRFGVERAAPCAAIEEDSGAGNAGREVAAHFFQSIAETPPGFGRAPETKADQTARLDRFSDDEVFRCGFDGKDISDPVSPGRKILGALPEEAEQVLSGLAGGLISDGLDVRHEDISGGFGRDRHDRVSGGFSDGQRLRVRHDRVGHADDRLDAPGQMQGRAASGGNIRIGDDARDLIGGAPSGGAADDGGFGEPFGESLDEAWVKVPGIDGEHEQSGLPVETGEFDLEVVDRIEGFRLGNDRG